MLTAREVRAEFYNAILDDTEITNVIGQRLYWIGKITENDTFPLITFARYDATGGYSYGLVLEKEDIIFETKIYADKMSNVDILVERLKVKLLNIGYRNLNSPAEFLEEEINKKVAVIRWEKINT